MMSIREKVIGTSWAKALLGELREELDEFCAGDGFQIPEEPGGWWHQYVCPEHHTELLFNPQEADAMQYWCPHGCKLSGEPYRGAWLVFKHQSLARYALQAAAVYAGTGEGRYAELARTILEQYARQFPLYPVHPEAQVWMLKGRVFHQALTEAIWATTLIRAYLLLKDEGVEFGSAVKPLALFFEMLETSMTQYRQILIFERNKPESNYTAWLNAALAGVYAATGEHGKLEGLISGEGGIHHHLSIGVKPDQFEFEGSTYYHVFVLRAYLIMAEMAKRSGFDIIGIKGDEGQTFEGMFDVLAGLANNSGFLPALHDGPYQRLAYAREIAEIFEIGLANYGKAEYVPVLAEAYRQIGMEIVGGRDSEYAGESEGEGNNRQRTGWRNSLEALVFGVGDTKSNYVMQERLPLWLPDSGFAVGRVSDNPFSFLADFGSHGGSHGHYDKLHISLEHSYGGSLSPELGMVPYGSELRKGWYAGTSSHNTVTIGGQSQQEHTGEAVVWSESDDAVYLWMRSKDAYPGCVLQRHIFQTDAFILDWFDVVLEGEAKTIDWWHHGLGSFKLSVGDWENVANEPLGQEAGYEYIDVLGTVAGIRRPGALLLNQQTLTGVNTSIQLWNHANSNVYHVDSPGPADNPVQRTQGLLHRVEATKATFLAIYHPIVMPIGNKGNSPSAPQITVGYASTTLSKDLHLLKIHTIFNSLINPKGREHPMASPLYQPESGALTIKYEPNEATCLKENPPRFTWMPAQLEGDRYVLEISSSLDFPDELTETFQPISYNLFTPSHPLMPGTYYWRYALLQDDGEHSEWSVVRSFVVTDGLPETPLPSPNERYNYAGEAHPRLWLQAEEVVAFRKRIRVDNTYCSWDIFMEKSVLPWTKRDFIQEPSPYPDNKRVAILWRQMYMDCQEVLYAIRHLAIAGVILEDAGLISKAKEWLLLVAAWDPEGTTSRDYNDEAAFRIAEALAWGYDWLHTHLSEEERSSVRDVLLCRTQQVSFHVIERSKIHQVPYDSHAVRSLSSVLTPCCIAMLHEEPKAREWLDYTIEYFAALYSPWGGVDGGWAEGPMYWTTGMAFVTEAMNLLNKCVRINFFRRPFFQQTGDFPFYCFSPDTLRASFGDQSTLGDPVSLKTGFNIRQFAGVTGNGYYQWYYEQVKAMDSGSQMKFYNYGWWDFQFDELKYLHDYPAVEAKAPIHIESVKWFRDIGWVAFHAHMDRPEDHIMLLTKSSPYGSISHSHGDQNGFLLHAYGEPLAIESGYYIAFNSSMHMNWRKQTRSTNNILIDGIGQYAGTNKVLNMAASGIVEAVETHKGYTYSRCNATAAYQENTAYLQRYIRELYFINESYIVVVDQIDLSQPARVDWLFHTLHEMKLDGQTFKLNGRKANMDGRFIYSSSGDLQLSQHNEFIGVNAVEIEGLDREWHLTATTRMARSHRIVTLLVPLRKEKPKYVSYFMDDQDHGVHIYFTENGITQRVEVTKAY
jgi:hypothetical protein